MLFAGKFSLAVLNGIAAPINAYLLKILIENITKNDFETSLITIAVILLFNLMSGFFAATIRKKLERLIIIHGLSNKSKRVILYNNSVAVI